MAPSRRTLSIALALLISASFVTAGYALSSDTSALSAGATSTEELMREYAKKDTDADGLPDWKEALYGADPANPRSLDASMTDLAAVEAGKVEPKFRSEAPAGEDEITDEDFTVPRPGKGTVTDEFAKAFFESYVNTVDGDMAIGMPDDAFIASLSGDLNARLRTKLTSTYTSEEVVVAAPGGEAAYLSALEAGLREAAVPGVGSDPITLIDRFVTKGDASAEPEIRTLVENYRASAKLLKSARVPESLVASHVTLVRTTEQLAGAMETVANFHTDPLATIGGLSVFEPAFRELYLALTAMQSTLTPGGAVPGMPGGTLAEYVRILSIFKP